MKVTIASGKGGTGKTTIATNLAMVASGQGSGAALLDCDVEEPNCHIFMKPQIRLSCPVTVPVPKIDIETCTNCGKCAEVCQYNAIICLKDQVLVFSELCHGCGSCTLNCPRHGPGAIRTGKISGPSFNGKITMGTGTPWSGGRGRLTKSKPARLERS